MVFKTDVDLKLYMRWFKSALKTNKLALPKETQNYKKYLIYNIENHNFITVF